MPKLHAINLITRRDGIIYNKDTVLLYHAKISACNNYLKTDVSIYRLHNLYYIHEQKDNEWLFKSKETLYEYDTLKKAWTQKRNAFRRLRKYTDFQIDIEETHDNFDFSEIRK